MITVVIQIGNSDDKLTQRAWSNYVENIACVVRGHAHEIHFSGGADVTKPWQNYCFVLTMNEMSLDQFKKRISEIRDFYKQDSVAIIAGSTEFV